VYTLVRWRTGYIHYAPLVLTSYTQSTEFDSRCCQPLVRARTHGLGTTIGGRDVSVKSVGSG
jgi:hypothetical protein